MLAKSFVFQMENFVIWKSYSGWSSKVSITELIF